MIHRHHTRPPVPASPTRERPAQRFPAPAGRAVASASPSPGPLDLQARLQRAVLLGHNPGHVIQRTFQYGGNVFSPYWTDSETKKVYVFDKNGPSADDVYVSYIWVKPRDGEGESVAIRFFDKEKLEWKKVPEEERKKLDAKALEEKKTPDVMEDEEGEDIIVESSFEKGESQEYSLEEAEKALSTLYRISKLSTSYTAQVSVIPTSKGRDVKYESLGFGEPKYGAKQVWVLSVTVSDQDRPDTRFENQESHTVAWTLVRRATMRLGGRTVWDLLKIFESDFTSLASFAVLDEAKILLEAATGNKVLETARSGELPVDIWQQLLSKVVQLYAQVYQLSTAATYKRGTAKGHGEAKAIERLQGDEEKLEGKKKTRAVKAISTDMQKLIDVQFRIDSLGVQEYAFAVRHWIDSLKINFPLLMKEHGDDLVKPVLDKKLTKTFLDAVDDEDVTTVRDLLDYFDYEAKVGAPHPVGEVVGGISISEPSLGQLRSSFVANIGLEPLETGEKKDYPLEVGGEKKTVQTDAYKPAQVEVGTVTLGDQDRPKTKFIKAQKSHTVAWTLVRNEVIGYKGRSLGDLLSFLEWSFTSLKGDIEHDEGLTLAETALSVVKKNKGLAHPIHDWQSLVSTLVRWHFIAYQVSESASYLNPQEVDRALGHGEAKHMLVLRRNEYSLQSGLKLADSPERVVQAATALLDAVVTGTLSEKSIVKAFEHWRKALTSAFPKIMALGGEQIVGAMLKKKVGKSGETFQEVLQKK